MITPHRFIMKWLGTPHVYDGRDKQGIDCWGLVCAYYREVLGTELPDWRRADKSRRWVCEVMNAETAARIDWIDQPQDHCIAFAVRNTGPHHAGIWWRGAILHVQEGSTAMYLSESLALQAFGGAIKYGVPHD